jgi:hypothetical protein
MAETLNITGKVPIKAIELVAKEYGQRIGISRVAMESMRMTQWMEPHIDQLVLAIHGFLYGESLLTETRHLPFRQTVTTWGHTGKLVAWYAPWFGRRWEATTIEVSGTVAVTAEHFSAFPDLPVRPHDWGRPVRMTVTDTY